MATPVEVEPEILKPVDPAESGSNGHRQAAKKSAPKKRARAVKATGDHRGRGATRSFPTSSFEDAMELAKVIQQSGVDNKMRRLTLFDGIGKSPDSGSSRALVTNSSRYGLTKGSYKAEYIELTENGRIAVDPDVDPGSQLRARITLAVLNIPPFARLYQKLAGNKLPAQAVMYDLLKEVDIPDTQHKECVDIFLVNLKFLGLIRTISGAERVLTAGHAAEESANAGGGCRGESRLVPVPLPARLSLRPPLMVQIGQRSAFT